MKNSHISLKAVDLHYASVAYREQSLLAALAEVMKPPSRRRMPLADIHALKNISVEIGAGARVGLLGHNGAGKSTLLKAISGLYPTSSGRIDVAGAVHGLFDLSIGFEPYATGRENILYRGLLLGHTPARMRELAPEIIKFADLGDFIDYPIKTYSAGMLVRLAFAISTAANCDILLLDEVIGAGDATFMQKARQRIAGLIDRAEILVLASHDLASLQGLCERGLVLHHGELVDDAPIAAAIQCYRQINGVAA